MIRPIFATSLMLVLTACSSGGGNNSELTLIDPTNNPDALMDTIEVKAAGQTALIRTDAFPAPEDLQTAPAVSADNTELQSPEAEEVQLLLNFETDAPLSRLFVKVVGAQSYAEIDLSQRNASKAELLSLDLSLPENLSDGRFCVDINAQDINGVLFQPLQVCITVESSQDDEIQASPTPSATPSTSPSPTPQNSPEPTASPLATQSPAPTASPEPSVSPSAQPTVSPSPTPSVSPAANWDSFNWDQADWQ